MFGKLEGLKEHDNVLIIKDQTADHSMDKTFHPTKGFMPSNNTMLPLVKAKDVPTMFQTELEKENQALKSNQEALANNMAEMQAMLRAQQEEMAAMKAMIAEQQAQAAANAAKKK